ncbi:MAG: hypothetical protein MK086_07025 [Flavobacteriales bacterium]|nr:hypothetical protein [Flavobacteriales bacterium]
MLKNVSRRTKKSLPILVNIVYAIIVIFKIVTDMEAIKYLQVWLIACPIIVISNLFKTEKRSHPSIKHVLLFMLTGGAIGTRVARLFKQEVSTPEFIWLLTAIFVEAIHYSPSNKNK